MFKNKEENARKWWGCSNLADRETKRLIYAIQMKVEVGNAGPVDRNERALEQFAKIPAEQTSPLDCFPTCSLQFVNTTPTNKEAPAICVRCISDFLWQALQ